jgi:two-component system, cell cycle sensor histidine kinase and response regulator CckA
MKDKKLQSTLSNPDNKYEQLFNNVHIGVLIVDDKRHILEVNQTFCNLFGYAQAAEVIGLSVRMLHVSDGSYRRFGKLVFDKVMQNQPLSIRYELQKKDGSSLWVRISGQPDPKKQAVLWTIVDISEHVHNENSLRAERDFSNSLIQTAQIIVLVLDVNGNIVQINSFMEELTGYKQDEVIGKDWFDTFLPTDDHAELRAIFQDVVGNIHIRGHVNPILTKNGHELIIEWNNETLKSPQGEVLGVLCVGQDITERKQIELVKERLLRAVDQSGEAIVITDPEGTIQYVNPAFIAVTGYSIEEAIGQNPRVLKSEKHSADFYRDMWSTLTSGATWHGRLYNKRKDGTLYTEDATISPVKNAKGNIINYVAVKRDVSRQIIAETEHAKLEEQLRQKHKMEAVGYMAGGMAHNCNNNLSIILGNIELSQMKLPEDSEIAPLLKNAKTAILHSKDLVLKILTYSRQGIQNRSPIQLSAIIDESIARLQSTLPTTVSLQWEISPESRSNIINADPSRIQEALTNLCNNAVRAMNGEGELKILLSTVELSEKEIPAQYEASSGCYAKLSVQDTGCGMTTEMLEKIFDPFFSTKEEYKGAGMGLATVQGIVAQHGGVIKVNSIPNQGTVFNLYFPTIDGGTTEPINEDPLKGTETILLINDEEMLAKLGKDILSEMGYRVTTMAKCQEALQLFNANPDHFDLLITDQTMLDPTGKELIPELKKIRPDLRTILCTGFDSQKDKDQAKRLGIDAFCTKPLNLSELLQTVRQVLDKKRE